MRLPFIDSDALYTGALKGMFDGIMNTIIDSDALYTGALNLDLDLDGIMNTVQHQLCTSRYM